MAKLSKNPILTWVSAGPALILPDCTARSWGFIEEEASPALGTNASAHPMAAASAAAATVDPFIVTEGKGLGRGKQV